MINYGEIHLVNCEPSIGKEYKKVRPALVVQTNAITNQSSIVTVIPIASKSKNINNDEIIVKKDEKNRLMKNSVLRVRQISTFDKKRFIHRIGEVDDLLLNKVKLYLKKHFGL